LLKFLDDPSVFEHANARLSKDLVALAIARLLRRQDLFLRGWTRRRGHFASFAE
jgi:hypothetical protein